MGCVRSTKEPLEPDLMVKEAEEKLDLANIDVEKAFSLLRKFSLNNTISEYQLSHILFHLQKPDLKRYLPLFQVSKDRFSQEKLIFLFVLLSNSPLEAKLKVILLFCDPNFAGKIEYSAIKRVSECLLFICIDFSLSLIKETTPVFAKYKHNLIQKRLLPETLKAVSRVVSRGGSVSVSSVSASIIGDWTNPQKIRKIVENVKLIESDEINPENQEKQDMNLTISAAEAAKKEKIRSEYEPKMKRGPLM